MTQTLSDKPFEFPQVTPDIEVDLDHFISIVKNLTDHQLAQGMKQTVIVWDASSTLEMHWFSNWVGEHKQGRWMGKYILKHLYSHICSLRHTHTKYNSPLSTKKISRIRQNVTSNTRRGQHTEQVSPLSAISSSREKGANVPGDPCITHTAAI